MSPLPIHELYKTWFGRLMDVLSEELSLAMIASGTTTFRCQDQNQGFRAWVRQPVSPLVQTENPPSAEPVE